MSSTSPRSTFSPAGVIVQSAFGGSPVSVISGTRAPGHRAQVPEDLGVAEAEPRHLGVEAIEERGEVGEAGGDVPERALLDGAEAVA